MGHFLSPLIVLVLLTESATTTTSSEPKTEPQGPTPGQRLEHPLAAAEEIVFRRTNEFRDGESLSPLKRDDTLDTAAQWFANYMAETGNYGHEADGREPADRISAAGYKYCRVGENIAWQVRERSDGTTVPIETEPLGEKFFTGWRDSKPHRENILTPQFTHIGLGLARAGDGKYYGVQLFGRPKSLQFRVELSNQSGEAATYEIGEDRFELGVRMWRQHTLCEPTPLAIDDDERSVSESTRFVLTQEDGQWTLTTDGKPRDLKP